MYLQMKLLNQLLVAVSLAFLWSYPLSAGDKIIMTEGKLPAGPANLKLGNDLFKERVRIDDSAPDLGMPGIPSLPRSPLSRKDQQLLKDRQAERKNWLVLEPGTLQRKREQETSMGVENNPINRLDKEDARNDGPKDYTFYGIGEKKSSQRQPGEIRVPGHALSKEEIVEANRAAQEQRARDEAEDEGNRRSKATFDLTGSTAAQSAHTSSELNFSTLLQPDQKETISSAAASKGEFSLRDIIAPVGDAPKNNKHAADFNNLLSPQSSFSLPVTAGPSLGSVAPGLASKPPEVSTPRFPSSDFSVGQNPVNSMPNRYNPSALPSFNNTPGLTPSSPFLRPQVPTASDSSKNWRNKPADPPRRPGGAGFSPAPPRI